jgi:hypothetical protein
VPKGVEVYEAVRELALTNLLVEGIETVGREMMLVKGVGVSDPDTIAEEPVGSLIPDEVSRYSVEVHCETTE